MIACIQQKPKTWKLSRRKLNFPGPSWFNINWDGSWGNSWLFQTPKNENKKET